MHTLNPSCAHCSQAAGTARAGHYVVARRAPYRGPLHAVSLRASAPCRCAATFAPGHNTIFVSRHKSPAARTTRRVMRLPTVSQRLHSRVVACLATQGRVAGPFRSRYKICIATPAPAARVATPTPYRGASCAVSWCILRRIEAMSLPYRRVCHDTPQWPSRASALAAVSRLCSAVSQALPGRIVGMAWPYRGPCSCAQLPCIPGLSR